MVREAAARLYDVDHQSVVVKKRNQSKQYDVGTVTFRPKPGRLIDLDELHESVWATRLSRGTHSGLVSLDVAAAGTAAIESSKVTYRVPGATAYFELDRHPESEFAAVFDRLRSAIDGGERIVKVTGRIEGWSGRWPNVLKQLPGKPRRILVTDFEIARRK